MAGDDSDDDQPIMMTLLKSKAEKLLKIKLEGAEAVKKGEKNRDQETSRPDAVISSKASSSSSIASREETSKSITTLNSTGDSEDDLPISELMKRRLRTAVKLEPKSKSASAPITKVASSSKKVKVEENNKDKKKIDDGKKEPVAERKSSSDKTSEKAIPPGLGSEFYETKKGIKLYFYYPSICRSTFLQAINSWRYFYCNFLAYSSSYHENCYHNQLYLKRL